MLVCKCLYFYDSLFETAFLKNNQSCSGPHHCEWDFIVLISESSRVPNELLLCS